MYQGNFILLKCIFLFMLAIIISIIVLGCNRATNTIVEKICEHAPELSMDAKKHVNYSYEHACTNYKVMVPNFVMSYNTPKYPAYAALKIGEYYWCYKATSSKVLTLHSMRLDIECGHPVGQYYTDFNSNSMLFKGEDIEFMVLKGTNRAHAFIFLERL